MRTLQVTLIAMGLLLLWPCHLGSSAEEPNNDMANATPLHSGVEISDGINALSDEVDWFFIPSDAGKVLNATLYTVDYPALNASLEVYDGAGVRQGYSVSPHRFETAVIVTASAGEHFIRVFVEPGNGGGRYTLTVTVTDAIDIVPGTRYPGTLRNDTNNPAQIYRVFLKSGDTVTARLEEAPLPPILNASLDLYLMDLWPAVNRYTYLDVSWWGDPVETVSGKASHDGYYYIIPTAFNGSGSYSLSVDVNPGLQDGDGFPPRAQPVFARAVINDSVEQSLDHYDFYSLKVETGEHLGVALNFLDGWTSGIFEFDLLDSRLRTIISLTNYISGTEPSTTDRLEFNWTFSSGGTFYLMVMAKWGLSPLDAGDLTDAPAQAAYTLDFRLARQDRPPSVAHPLPAAGTDEDTPCTIDLAGVFDDPDIPEGDALSFSAAGSSHLEMKFISESVVSITPAPDWSGRETISLRAMDSLGLSAELTIGFNVNPKNDPPEPMTVPGAITFEDGKSYPRFIYLPELFSDPDSDYGDTLSYRVAPSQLGLYIEPPGFLSSGTIPSAAGSYIVALTARDSSGSDAVLYLNISVVVRPHPPVALTPLLSLQIDEDTPATGPFTEELFQDPEGSPLTFQFRNPGKISVAIRPDGALQFFPEQDWAGSEDIFAEATDAQGLSANLIIRVTVKPVEDGPRILEVYPAENVTMVRGDDRALRVTATDAETPLALNYSWTSGPGVLASSSRYGNVLSLKGWAPGNYLVTVTVRDGAKMTSNHSWAVSVFDQPVVDTTPGQRQQVSGGAVVAVGFGTWLIAFLGLTEQGKYGLLKFLVVPLYTKIHKEEVLDHFTRGRIYGIVESNPGVHYTLIKKKLGVGNGTLAYHLATLEREGFIRSEWDGLYKRFYPSQMGYSAAKPGGEVLELSRVETELLSLIKRAPGISQKEITEQTGLSKRVVSYHIAQMSQSRHIRVERDGKRVRCFVLEPAS